MADLLNDPEMDVNDFTATGSTADGDVSWEATNTWIKISGTLKVNSYDQEVATIHISNLLVADTTYRLEYEITVTALLTLRFGPARLATTAEKAVGTHTVDIASSLLDDILLVGTGNEPSGFVIIPYFRINAIAAEEPEPEPEPEEVCPPIYYNPCKVGRKLTLPIGHSMCIPSKGTKK